MSFLLNSPGFVVTGGGGGGTANPFFIFATTGEAYTSFVTIPGLTSGDLILLASMSTSTGVVALSGSTSMVNIGSGPSCKASYYVASASDATNGGVSLTNGGGSDLSWSLSVYRGPTSAAYRNIQDTGNPCAVTGFTKNGSSKGVVGTWNATVNQAAITPPTDLTQRSVSANNRCYVGDVSAAGYVNGTAESFAFTTTPCYGILIELL